MVRIVLGGRPGSGKTATSQLLAEITGYAYFSVGRNLTRPLADRFGMQVGEFYRKHSQPGERLVIDGQEWHLDDYLDAKQVEWAKAHPDSVIESRLGWYFVPRENTLRVLLDVSPVVAAERVMRNQRPDERYCDIHVAMQSLESRLHSEQETYRHKYGIADYLAPANYDVIVPTDSKNAAEVSLDIIGELRKRGFVEFK